ncbi:MAG: Wzz/FepE/Etk N-terminal domain-containing protein [Eubacteriales bacterium]|nr:Wzz/FepE/Etk N-terminal domain-containing protein [Eubacteriales bacterium]
MEHETIDLMQMLRIVRKRIWIIVLAAFLCVGASGIVSYFVLEEEYKADVLLYIWQESDESGKDAVNYSDLQLFAQLVNDYQELAKSRLVTGIVAEELGLPETSIGNIRNMITVGNKANTRHLTIVVNDTDPVFAATLANKVAEVFSRVVVEKMGAGQVNIIDNAIVPTAPSAPNKPMNLVVGLVLGIMLGLGIVFLIEFLDTSVKTAEDVERVTSYTLLGAVPEFAATRREGRH